MIKIISVAIIAATISGCASPEQKKHPYNVVAGRNVPAYAVRTVRGSEIIKIYKTGRRIDPSNPNIMHEAGEMYVINRSPAWNLRPNIPISNPAFKNHSKPVNVHNANMRRQQALLKDTNVEMSVISTQIYKSREELKDTGKIAKDKEDLKQLVEELKKEQGKIKRKLAEQNDDGDFN
jgi:hypothetical protein